MSPVGVLIVRAWWETGPTPSLRARITYTADITTNESMVDYRATAEGVGELVQRWLGELLRDGDAPVTPTATPPVTGG